MTGGSNSVEPSELAELVNEDPPTTTPASGVPTPDQELASMGTYSEGLKRAEVRIAQQKVWLRWGAFGVAVVAVVAGGFLEWFILDYLMNREDEPSDWFFILASAPILSITLIVIFMLIGVFRGYRDGDISSTPVETAAKLAIGSD